MKIIEKELTTIDYSRWVDNNFLHLALSCSGKHMYVYGLDNKLYCISLTDELGVETIDEINDKIKSTDVDLNSVDDESNMYFTIGEKLFLTNYENLYVYDPVTKLSDMIPDGLLEDFSETGAEVVMVYNNPYLAYNDENGKIVAYDLTTKNKMTKTSMVKLVEILSNKPIYIADKFKELERDEYFLKYITEEYVVFTYYYNRSDNVVIWWSGAVYHFNGDIIGYINDRYILAYRKEDRRQVSVIELIKE